MENILLEKEQLGEEAINTSVQNNKSVCENSQMEDEKNTNDVAECTDGSAENHKPIPVIETNIENTDIEKTVVESREDSNDAAITKPVSLSFVSESRFQKLYKDIEEELFSKGDTVDSKNRTSQTVKAENGVFAVELSRTTGPEAIWFDKEGMKENREQVTNI